LGDILLKRMSCGYVDWSGGLVAPRGLAIGERRLKSSHPVLTLRFRTKNICGWRYAFAQKTSVADATLSHKKHLWLTLRFRTKKTSVAPSGSSDAPSRNGNQSLVMPKLIDVIQKNQ